MPTTPDITAGTIMDSSAALLGDPNKTNYTYAKQIPYLKIALKELRELFELNSIPVTQEISPVLNVPAGTTSIGFNTIPVLPSNLVQINKLWERAEGIDPFVPMVKKHSIIQSGTDQSSFGIWAWDSNKITVPRSNRDNDLKIDGVVQLFASVVDENSIIGVINAESYLGFKTASLCARYLSYNNEIADSLDDEAALALERAYGIENKAKQAITTRHKPFRASYKRHG